MEEDRFDRKIIDIESMSFELNMLLAGFVFDILHCFDGYKTDISCEIPYLDPVSGLCIVTVNSLHLDNDRGVIDVIADSYSEPLMWDELSISARESVVVELNHKYKSLKLLNNLKAGEDIH